MVVLPSALFPPRATGCTHQSRISLIIFKNFGDCFTVMRNLTPNESPSRVWSFSLKITGKGSTDARTCNSQDLVRGHRAHQVQSTRARASSTVYPTRDFPKLYVRE